MMAVVRGIMHAHARLCKYDDSEIETETSVVAVDAPYKHVLTC